MRRNKSCLGRKKGRKKKIQIISSAWIDRWTWSGVKNFHSSNVKSCFDWVFFFFSFFFLHPPQSNSNPTIWFWEHFAFYVVKERNSWILFSALFGLTVNAVRAVWFRTYFGAEVLNKTLARLLKAAPVHCPRNRRPPALQSADDAITNNVLDAWLFVFKSILPRFGPYLLFLKLT